MSEEANEDKSFEQISPSTQVGVIKKGDYLIHIMIHEARNLKMKGSDNVDPI
jgi:hypothetical protein